MKKHLLLLLALVTLTGCGDTADTILRTAINRKCELTDRLTMVNDEAGAQKYIDHYHKNYVERVKDLDDKWQKWNKDIDSETRSKKITVLDIKSTGELGSEQWQRDARNVPGGTDEGIVKLIQTREAFISYVIKINADQERYNRELTRIDAIVKHLRDENPNTDPKQVAPSLTKLLEPSMSQRLNLTGAEIRR